MSIFSQQCQGKRQRQVNNKTHLFALVKCVLNTSEISQDFKDKIHFFPGQFSKSKLMKKAQFFSLPSSQAHTKCPKHG